MEAALIDDFLALMHDSKCVCGKRIDPHTPAGKHTMVNAWASRISASAYPRQEAPPSPRMNRPYSQQRTCYPSSSHRFSGWPGRRTWY